MNISESCLNDIPSPTYDHYHFAFEKNFDHSAKCLWFVENWSICFYFIAIYLVAIFTGQHLMKSREPFQLRGALFLWNLILALFSIVACIRLLAAQHYMLRTLGFHGTICESGPMQHNHAGSFWAYLFCLSKVVQFGDTSFIVLRKRPLMFLHWYHHISVVVFTWSTYAHPYNISTYFCIFNLLVHSCMYSYYAFKVLRFKIPRVVSIAITFLELVQMMAGVFITAYAYWAKSQNPDCCVCDQVIYIAAAIYSSYLVLFSNFFIRVYITNKGAFFDEKGSIKKIM